MTRTTLDALEAVSSKMENIIGTMSLLATGIGDKTATRLEASGCAQLVIRAIAECKCNLDEAIGSIFDSEVLE